MAFLFNPTPIWHNDSLEFMVKAHAGSKRNYIDRFEHGLLHVFLNAQPVQGKANKALCIQLAIYFGVTPAKVSVIKGETSAMKCIRVLNPQHIPVDMQAAMQTAISGKDD